MFTYDNIFKGNHLQFNKESYCRQINFIFSFLKNGVSTIILFLTSLSLFSQEVPVQFKHLSVSDGLSDNHLTSIVKDKYGFLWFGTSAGLNRYDGHGFKIFKQQSGNTKSISDNSVQSIFNGPNDCLWINTSSGLNVFDPVSFSFERNADSLLTQLGLPNTTIVDIKKDRENNYWFLFANGDLYKYHRTRKLQKIKNPKTQTKITGIAIGSNVWIIHENGSLFSLNSKSSKIENSYDVGLGIQAEYQIYIDKDELPWVFCKNNPLGVFWFTQASVKRFNSQSDDYKLNNNLITNIVQDENGHFWIGTDHGGINLFDPKSQTIRYLLHDEFNNRSLSHNSTTSLYKDSEGVIWVGTFKEGVSYYHPRLIQFPLFKHQTGNSNSLPYEDVNRFVEDEKGNLWIGTNGGGLIYHDRKRNSYKQYNLQETGNKSNVIVSLLLDSKKRLWIGTYYAGLYMYENGVIKRFVNSKQESNSISDDSIWELFEDSKGRIWIGTLSGGLNVLETGTETFRRLQKSQLRSSYVSAIMEDKYGNIWIGTSTGIEILNKDIEKIKEYRYNAQRKNTLSNEYVSSILQDSKGRIWVATRDGLNLFDNSTDGFKVFGINDGLTDNNVLCILEDNSENIWISTSKGVSTLNLKGDTPLVRNYSRQDGLQVSSFNENAALKLSSGALIFGGSKGYNIITPSTIPLQNVLPKPVLSDFQLQNRSIITGEKVDGNLILSKAPYEYQTISLAHNQNMIALVVSSLHIFQKGFVKLQYLLEGSSTGWIDLDNESRKATFTNLDPGKYVFKVRYSPDMGEGSEEFPLAAIIVKPPFWRTGWAIMSYILLFMSVLFSIRKYERNREKVQFRITQEREEAKRIMEMDRMKTQFFTNVSHEFRTPITLILSPLEKIIQDSSDGPIKGNLELINRNARRLLNLVNQLLDFRKIDNHSLQANLQPGDILQTLREHAQSFADLAESKRIEYIISVESGNYDTSFDHDKVERIVFNLLSNAFKFTPNDGKVWFSVLIKENATLVLEIKDSGVGIPEEVKGKIFDRFYQYEAPSPLLNQGSGIGLSITSEYVNFLGGTIEVFNNTEGSGTAFVISIPLEAGDVLSKRNNGVSPLQKSKQTIQRNPKERVLIVEDHYDMRLYLIENLKDFFLLQEAFDGKDAWEKILAFHPDVIVSDVNMPVMNGIELSKKVKADSRTTHIPVILLTALSSDKSQLEGLETGASDYVVKPFNIDILLSKIHTLIRQKSSMEKTYKKQLAVNTSNPELESLDEKFMRTLLLHIENNIGDPDFSVGELAEKMNISRVGLYKKLLALTAKTPSEFLRKLRLQRAAHLLETSGMTVSEVAYQVGFNNPKAFSKYFKHLFGKLPSEYRK